MNKPVFEPVNFTKEHSFSVNAHVDKTYSSFYHYHPHYELTLIRQGEGQLLVNNGNDYFNDGDLVLLGPYVPHCWKFDVGSKLDQKDDCDKGSNKLNRITIQFSNDFLGEDFFDKPELFEIKNLLQKSKRGVLFKKVMAGDIGGEIEKLVNAEVNFKKLLAFLDILYKMSLSKESVLMSYLGVMVAPCTIDQERITRINNYILGNYRTDVSLREVSDIACMTPNAFCRYFKKTTQRTFIEVIVEHRIKYAVGQLLKTNKSINQICFDSGFNDFVHFSRVFKARMNVSPLQYRKKYSRELNDLEDSAERIGQTGAA